jgi:hypothetical protein
MLYFCPFTVSPPAWLKAGTIISSAFLVSIPRLLVKGRVHPTFSVFTSVLAGDVDGVVGAGLQATSSGDAAIVIANTMNRAIFLITFPPWK